MTPRTENTLVYIRDGKRSFLDNIVAFRGTPAEGRRLYTGKEAGGGRMEEGDAMVRWGRGAGTPPPGEPARGLVGPQGGGWERGACPVLYQHHSCHRATPPRSGGARRVWGHGPSFDRRACGAASFPKAVIRCPKYFLSLDMSWRGLIIGASMRIKSSPLFRSWYCICKRL